ncbi:PREDICTED: uncharacterized protein LOC109156278 [Ipomoea nil]|uniref:uncharacterized protein LOC109156278 n=1 Tax=Ipomoea nil TaxID=35883 RepID=UPI000900F781|nr:PREDICTED: uncharacterized protein LOC109156278 [Ipomoea nil]
MTEEKLDRILACEDWLNLFQGAQAHSLVVPYSDHLPLVLTPVTIPRVRRQARFYFYNMWLREETCREIFSQSWDRTVGLDTLARVEACAPDISKWGRNYNRDFQRKIEHNKGRLVLLRGNRDEPWMREYDAVEWELLFLLEQQHSFCKQRAKEFWYQGGDVNSKYFHNSVKARRCRNTIRRLQDENGNWVEDEEGLDNVMLNYYTGLFTPDYGEIQETQGREGVVALKHDMSKAYDWVEWEFLWAVLLKMGFGNRWVDILLETVSSVQYHILHDQRHLGPIIPGRGLRQGDPLSPYLFLFVVEGLTAMIERSMSAGRLHGVSVARGAPSVSHLLFADDSFLFLRANVGESVQMSANVPHNIRNEVVDILGVEEGETSGKYLGLPSLVGRRMKAILGFLKDRILTKIRSWNAKFLSRAGREVLLKNVL